MSTKKKFKKIRADQLLIDQNLVPDLDVARAVIMEGRVSVTGRRIDKPSELLDASAPLYIKGMLDKYVSRGAHKLKKALDVFSLHISGMICIDVGASTGGFTDVMLRAGAEKVYAVDVGYNQLDYKLRVDERVICMERVNARDLCPDMLNELPSFGATDVSFISLKLVLPAIRSILKDEARFVALIKPQFEAAQEDVGEKGVVRSRDVHTQVVSDILNFVQATGWRVDGLDYSPIRGPEGNIEFLLWITKAPAGDFHYGQAEAEAVVQAAYDKFITNRENT